MDTGDFVIIINADKIRVTGTKELNKVYYHHTGHPGGLKSETFAELCQAPRARHRAMPSRHAAEEHAGPQAGLEAEGLRWCRAPAYGSEATEIKMEG